MSTQWFPATQYKQALAHAITTARGFNGRFQVGLEKFSDLRAGFAALPLGLERE